MLIPTLIVIDTVSLHGKGFSQNVSVGQHVKAGDLLGTFDRSAIKAAGLDDTLMMIITNSTNYKAILPINETPSVKVGQKILSLN